jgi:hypothetical protein
MVTHLLKTNIIRSTGTGLPFDADNETWVINPHTVVRSPDGWGVESDFFNSTLVNRGFVDATGGWASIDFDGNGNAHLENRAGGRIVGSGGFGALEFDNNGKGVANNSGKIINTSPFDGGVIFGSSTNGVVLNNHGYLFGGRVGVNNDSDNAGGAIHNFGTVRGGVDGIFIGTAAGLVTSISNAAGAVVRGAVAAVESADGGAFQLVNHGTLIGNVVDADGARDVIVNTGKIKGMVELGSGKDYFNGTGGTSGTIVANGGSDRIIAGQGDDRTRRRQ